MEMIRDTLFGDARAKLAELSKNEGEAMQAVEKRTAERMTALNEDAPVNRHERRRMEVIERKTRKLEAVLKG